MPGDTASDWLGLGGRVCVVTGAGGGIGGAIAAEFARAGAKVALLDRDAAAAERNAAALAATGATAVGLACDTSDVAGVAAVAARIAADLGAADALVNAAAILRPGGLDTVPIADWNAMLAVNLTGCLVCAQAFGAGMRARGRGAIVHIASIAASNPQPFSGAYSVSKAGLAMLSRQIALEWGPAGVRSNVVSPGLVRTPMSEAFYKVPEVLERRTAMVPSRRVGTARDMADATLFLASDRASYVNGREIVVDGGLDQVMMGLVPRPGFGS